MGVGGIGDRDAGAGLRDRRRRGCAEHARQGGDRDRGQFLSRGVVAQLALIVQTPAVDAARGEHGASGLVSDAHRGHPTEIVRAIDADNLDRGQSRRRRVVVAQLALNVQTPAVDAARGEHGAGGVVSDAHRGRPGEGARATDADNLDRGFGACRCVVAQLTGIVGAPAVDAPGGERGAGGIVIGAHRGHSGEGARAIYADNLDRGRFLSRGVVAQLAASVEAPAVDAAGGERGAGGVEPDAHRGHSGEGARATDADDRDRGFGVRRCGVAQPQVAVNVGAPAVDAPGSECGAGGFNSDAHRGHAGEEGARVADVDDRDRGRFLSRRVVAQLAVPVVSPTVDAAGGERGAGGVVSDAHRGHPGEGARVTDADDRDRGFGVCRCVVAQPAKGVVAPAVDAAGGVRGAGGAVIGAHRGRGHGAGNARR